MSENTISKARKTTRGQTIFLVQFAVLLALEAIVCFTPLGSLQITPAIVATLSHIPVILTAILLGTGAGAGMGFAFGLFSFLVLSFQLPSPFSAFFTPVIALPGSESGNPLSLLICFVPRILIGVAAGLAYSSMKKLPKSFSMSTAAILGTLTNTVLVVGGIYLLFREEVCELFPVLKDTSGFVTFLIAFVGVNGLLEFAAALVLTAPICIAVNKATQKAA